MQDAPHISPEARTLAAELIDQRRLTPRQLQQGLEWCARNGQTLIAFLTSFCSPRSSESPLRDTDTDDAQRRHFTRHDSDRTFWMEIDQKLVEVSALNVSRGGLAFKSRWTLPRGTELRLGADMQVLAIVRYCVDNGDGSATSGAEFEPKTVAEVQAIEAVLASLKSQTLG